ncbi:MAG TPA: hypothetical protein VHT91_30300 [Kofleriaceae bacterium]|jgi:hypothetical protein|nr:hypothetical protein [Kofleriaceae bacterium]
MSAAVGAVTALAVVTSLGALGACGGKPRPEEAARPPLVGDTASGDAAPGDAAPGDATPGDAGAAGPPARGATGDLQVRVEWPDVPVAARSSPGRTPCGTPRAPSVAPTTTWGIPDALVVVDGAPAPAAPPTARVTLADCALTPRIAAGAALAITSAVDRPARLVLRKRGALDHLIAGEPVPVQLPIAGHTVTAALDAGAIYALETDAPDPEVAFVAALPGHVTDATGHALVRDLSAGPHAVTAWLPPRAGQPARTGHGTATVTAGELTELTITLAP